MFYILLQLSVALLASSYVRAYKYSVNLPDSAQPEIEACIQKSKNAPVIPWQAELACGHEYFTKLGPNNLTDEDGAVFNNVVDDRFGHSPPSFGISKRREVRLLSEEEWQNVTDVFRELYESGILQSFGRLHGKAKLRAHKGGAFLPWHRVFLVHFEQEMRKINPSVSLPYWDYTLDYDIPQPYESVLWTQCFFGENNDTVQSSPFKFLYGAHGAFISRKLAENFYSTRLISKADIELLKGFCEFKDITTGVSREESDHNLETLHDSVHDYIGGDMGVVENSAYDPIFWLHHAFIDYIWETYRNHQTEKCPNVDIESDYRPFGDIGWDIIVKQSHEDPLFGYSHLKTVDGLWRNWTNMFYTYEPQPVCGSTCSGDYLYCDDNNRCLSRTKEACKKESTTLNKREIKDLGPLVPQLPCDTGTPLKGLRGDGRTRETSEAECEAILENERQVVIPVEPDQENTSNTPLKNFGFVVLGMVLGAIGVVVVSKIVTCHKNRNSSKYRNRS